MIIVAVELLLSLINSQPLRLTGWCNLRYWCLSSSIWYCVREIPSGRELARDNAIRVGCTFTPFLPFVDRWCAFNFINIVLHNVYLPEDAI